MIQHYNTFSNGVFFILSGLQLKNHQEKWLDDFLRTSRENYVPLQLSREIPFLDCEVELVSSRKAISKMNFTQPCGDRNLYETIVDEWLQPTGSEMKQRVVIVGRAQSRYDYIFYVSLEFINCADEMNILKFLVKDSSLMRWIDHQTNADFQMFKRVVERLHGSKQETVCIILDDLEKSNFTYENYVYNKGIFETTQAGYLVSNILRDWFQNSKIILLLRPWQYFRLNLDLALPKFQVIYVQGIDHKGQKNLGGGCATGCGKPGCTLGDACLGVVISKHVVDECSICKYSQNNNCHFEIQSLCYVPNNCKFLVELQQRQQQQQQQHQQQLVFQPAPPILIVIIVLIHELLNAYRRKEISINNSILEIVGKFAWSQYKENCFIFDESDLIFSGLSSEELSIFFSCYVENTSFTCQDSADFVFFFSHVLQQELLAALFLLSLSTDDFINELETCKKSFLGGSFAVLGEFMSTICTAEPLKKYHKTIFSRIQLDNFHYLQQFLGKFR